MNTFNLANFHEVNYLKYKAMLDEHKFIDHTSKRIVIDGMKYHYNEYLKVTQADVSCFLQLGFVIVNNTIQLPLA